MLYRDYIADEGEKRTRTVHVGIDTRGTFQFDRVNPIFDLPSIFSLPLSLSLLFSTNQSRMQSFSVDGIFSRAAFLSFF